MLIQRAPHQQGSAVNAAKELQTRYGRDCNTLSENDEKRNINIVRADNRTILGFGDYISGVVGTLSLNSQLARWAGGFAKVGQS